MSDPIGETSRDRPDGPATDKADPRPTGRGGDRRYERRNRRDEPRNRDMSDPTGKTKPEPVGRTRDRRGGPANDKADPRPAGRPRPGPTI
jgi:hypothetical protein